MALDEKQLANEITANVHKVAAATPHAAAAAAAAAAVPAADFCSI
jgi:hypothetical protein